MLIQVQLLVEVFTFFDSTVDLLAILQESAPSVILCILGNVRMSGVRASVTSVYKDTSIGLKFLKGGVCNTAFTLTQLNQLYLN